MNAPNCPHCGSKLPFVIDAYCPECREPLDSQIETRHQSRPSPARSGSQPPARSEPQPSGRVDVSVRDDVFPQVCILCGAASTGVASRQFHRAHTVGKWLLQKLLGGGLMASLLADEAFEERAIFLRLPVCGSHACDPRLHAIKLERGRRRKMFLTGVHPLFVDGLRRCNELRWQVLSNRADKPG